MKRAALAAAIVFASLCGGTIAFAQVPARSWEVSPYIGVLYGSGRVADGTEPTYGIRAGYAINRWWGVEFSYSGLSETPVLQTVGDRLAPIQTQFGIPEWGTFPVEGQAESDVQNYDFNVVLSTKPAARRWIPYVTAGMGLGDFQGKLTQDQVSTIFPLGPNAIPDPFGYTGDPSRIPAPGQVDQFSCPSCGIVITDPNDAVASRLFTTGGDLTAFDSTQWNVGGGTRILFTERMEGRLDARVVNGLTVTYNEIIVTAGLSFRLGGEGALDDDRDAVPTFRDHCVETPVGATVDTKGCPADQDSDKVLDGLDKCANTPTGWPIDEVGCPLDTDKDGVPDGQDTCATTPEGAVVDFAGCPVDTDGDGVPDGLDACDLTPTGAVVNASGCPLDADKDGVPDGIDTCAKTPAGLPVDAVGCPIDSDGDGLKDDVDRCREFAGSAGVDKVGCPLFKLDTAKKITLRALTFEYGSSALSEESRQELLGLAEALAHYSEVKVRIEGHTDEVGSDRQNYLVSLDRARGVEKYLVEQGIDPSRLTARGFGESQPEATNSTDEGRQLNRRVEVVPQRDEPPAAGPTPPPTTPAPPSEAPPVEAPPRRQVPPDQTPPADAPPTATPPAQAPPAEAAPPVQEAPPAEAPPASTAPPQS